MFSSHACWSYAMEEEEVQFCIYIIVYIGVFCACISKACPHNLSTQK